MAKEELSASWNIAIGHYLKIEHVSFENIDVATHFYKLFFYAQKFANGGALIDDKALVAHVDVLPYNEVSELLAIPPGAKLLTTKDVDAFVREKKPAKYKKWLNSKRAIVPLSVTDKGRIIRFDVGRVLDEPGVLACRFQTDAARDAFIGMTTGLNRVPERYERCMYNLFRGLEMGSYIFRQPTFINQYLEAFTQADTDRLQRVLGLKHLTADAIIAAITDNEAPPPENVRNKNKKR